MQEKNQNVKHHHHDHQYTKNKKVLTIAFIVTIIFAFLEIIYGVTTKSLSLLSDGIHMIGDGGSMLIALLAIILSTKSKYKIAEPLGAFINGMTLTIIPLYILWEAIERLKSGSVEILSKEMMIVAIIGLIVNVVVAIALSKADKENLNIKAAMLHIMADLLSSVGTIGVSIIIMFFDIDFIDSIASIVISIVILVSGVKITKESFRSLIVKDE